MIGRSYFQEERRTVRWSDLTPFEQGYAEALFAEVFTFATHHEPGRPVGFSDLSPEALALIRRDCAAAVAEKAGWTPLYRKTLAGGATFWADRNKYPGGWRTGSGTVWMPLTPYLADDGKVHLGGGPVTRYRFPRWLHRMRPGWFRTCLAGVLRPRRFSSEDLAW